MDRGGQRRNPAGREGQIAPRLVACVSRGEHRWQVPFTIGRSPIRPMLSRGFTIPLTSMDNRPVLCRSKAAGRRSSSFRCRRRRSGRRRSRGRSLLGPRATARSSMRSRDMLTVARSARCRRLGRDADHPASAGALAQPFGGLPRAYVRKYVGTQEHIVNKGADRTAQAVLTCVPTLDIQSEVWEPPANARRSLVGA